MRNYGREPSPGSVLALVTFYVWIVVGVIGLVIIGAIANGRTPVGLWTLPLWFLLTWPLLVYAIIRVFRRKAV